jgi:hypothetical protein
MAKLLVSLLSGALLFFVVPCAFGDLVPPYLSNVKVTLINGESVTGASYGLVSIFVSGTPPRQVKTVELSHTAGSVMGHFTFFDKSKSETYEKSTAQVSRLKLSVFTQYEVINQQQGGWRYYWIKEQTRVPISNILRIDTLKILGKGFAIFQDPALYANVKEPYLMVEDCGLGCPAKLYSEDKSIAKAQLKELWQAYLDCKYRYSPETSKHMNEIMSEYQLNILIDPFCID